ncbi:MAG: hypothetical protein AAF546_01090 [Verrucomicrobiota bacterium]
MHDVRRLYALFLFFCLITFRVVGADLPYESDFESGEGFSIGSLSSHPDWVFPNPLLGVEVTGSDAFSGAQSIRLSGQGDFSFPAVDSLPGQVRWLDFYLKPLFIDEVDLTAPLPGARAAVNAFVRSGGAGDVFVFNGDGLGGGSWVASGASIPLSWPKSQDWIRLTYRLDYGSKSWGLFINDELVFTDLGFLDNSLTGFEEFVFSQDASIATDLDFFYAGASNPLYSEHRPYLHAARITGLSSESWTPVTLPRIYENPVIVATPAYDLSQTPVAVRLRGVDRGIASFEIRVQDLSLNGLPLSNYEAEYLVVEAGVYTEAFHGIDMEASRMEIAQVDHYQSWLGQEIALARPIASPVVLGQVMSFNDSRWSVFWSHGGIGTAPAGSQIFIGRHVGEDPDQSRNPETVGYIVMGDSSGQFEGREFVASTTGDKIDSSRRSVSLSGTAVTSLVNLVATQAAMDGMDGTQVILEEPNAIKTGKFFLAVDEDQLLDPERVHTTEQAHYLALGLSSDLSADGDSIPDWWEQWYAAVNPFDSIDTIEQVTTAIDTDGDGVSDYAEDLIAHTDLSNPYDNHPIHGSPVYVDSVHGNDSHSGRVPAGYYSYDGPKQTITSGLTASNDNGLLVVAPGTYPESTINLSGKDITIQLSGPATLNP